MTEQERLAIEWHCEKLCRRFANHSDRDEFRDLCALFTGDGTYYRPSVPNVGIRGRETLYQAFLQRPPLVIRHLVLNCVIDVHSPTEASGFSYIVYLAAPADGGELPLTAGPMHVGEFRDRYVLEDGQWKFAERRGSLALKTP